jgi:hypothetical protein
MASEDQFRHYFPLMRRMIILVAVLTAVPVILWTITVFVRGYFGPPKIPAPRPLAAVSVEAPANPAAGQDTSAQPPAAAQQAKAPDAPMPIVEARVTATDARPMSPGAKGALLADRQAGSEGAASNPPSPAAAMPAASAGVDAKTGQMHASPLAVAPASAMPDTAAPTGALAAQEGSDAAQAGAEAALPAAEPLPGPVPLPRHRPRYFAMLQNGVPMPRPRPEGAGAASEANPGPLDWLQKLLQPQQ